MLKEFRYTGINQAGKPVQGVVLAHNKSTAKKLIHNTEIKQNISVNQIDQKINFLYKVRLPSGKKGKGKQAAFSKQELANALSNFGYANAKITPVIFDFQSNLLCKYLDVRRSQFIPAQEKMSYDKVLRMLAEEETNPTLRATLKKN